MHILHFATLALSLGVPHFGWGSAECVHCSTLLGLPVLRTGRLSAVVLEGAAVRAGTAARC